MGERITLDGVRQIEGKEKVKKKKAVRLREESLKVAGSWLKGGGQLESLEKKKGGERCDKKSIKEKDTVMRGEMGIEEK